MTTDEFIVLFLGVVLLACVVLRREVVRRREMYFVWQAIDRLDRTLSAMEARTREEQKTERRERPRSMWSNAR